MVEPFFRYLEKVYSRNGVAIKQEVSLMPRGGKSKGNGGGNKNVRFVGSRATSVSKTEAGCGHEGGSAGEHGSGEDGNGISSHKSNSDGEGDSDEDRAPSGTRKWECPRCDNLNPASSTKCKGTSQGEEEDGCLLARPHYEKYGVAQIKSGMTIRDSDWSCFYCGNNNFQFRDECNKCKLPKNEAQSDKFRMLERDGPDNVSADNSDE